jgi:hypothetical protein
LQRCWMEKPFSVEALVEKARVLCQPARTAD